MLASLVVLLMTVCVSAFAGLRDEAWTVNPSDFRYDMSLYFRMENKDFDDLSSYEIGAFVDDECRGLAEKLDLTQGESCLYMRIRSNNADGEKLTFYMKDKKTGQIVLVKGEDGSELTFKADSRVGMPSTPFVMSPYYHAVFKIDGEIVQSLEIGYGDPVVAPEVPAKEGYTFNGWGDLPDTMPAYDIEINSTYTVNMYSLTFKIDDEELFSGEVAYGSTIIAPEAPVKEGYSFSGWTDVPETMPAKDLVFEGKYEALLYNIVYKVDGEVVHTDQLSFGETIPVFNDVPNKVGYTFSGWTEIPETMPARDVEINGSFVVNHYTVTFYVGDEVLVSQELAYEEEIIVPEAPAKEGYSFSGWGDVPATMPAEDLVFKGDYSVNTYKVVFRIDQEIFQTLELEYGAEIVAPEAPEKEGHTFSGWGEVPATMPAYDLVFVGTYADNYYTITFKIGEEVIKMADLAYGSEIILPEVPEKEGYTFNGWGDVPATMPASNIEIVGSYTINNYSIIFKIDDEIIYNGVLAYGTEISAPQAPDKEGYSFSGWGIVPAVMPASDLVISGTYTVNTYSLSFLIDGEVYYTTQVAYGSEITVPEQPVKEGYTLVGWSDVPATMPAYDLNINGTYNVNSYSLTFKIGEDVIFEGVLPYGAEIIVPEAPVKEGHTFSGWGIVPATMPAVDLEITGSYEVNLYNLIFMVDDEVVYSSKVEYGAEIVTPFMPDKEGSTFSGWGVLPPIMPANDLVVKGTYSVNYYMLTFLIGTEVVSTGEIAYGAEIILPEAPDKEGYTFAGWGDVPATMPARNLEIFGSYDVNSYSLVFKIGDEVISENTVAYGSEIVAPEAPEKEGYSFMGWGVVPAVMPAQDVVITGSYELNSYSVVFKIGDEIIRSSQVPYGSEIIVPEVPEREGYTFSGWGEIPAEMPAKDLEFSGSYIVNKYTVTFTVDDEVIFTAELAYGEDIVLPEVPEKEGYTFSGWGIVPSTMPANDLSFSGVYDVNYYNLTFKINDEVVYSSSVAYGTEINAPEVSEIEGYTFSGWGDVPATMPASDLSITATYDVNYYTLTFMIGDEVIESSSVAYGTEIVAPEVSVEEGYVFDGWTDMPETMPAHDVVVIGTISPDLGAVDSVSFDAEYVTVVSIDGKILYTNIKASEVEDHLLPGIYIINGKKTLVKASR